jgi:multidrug efflux pump subunit AcrA (membrane-fusion protein)
MNPRKSISRKGVRAAPWWALIGLVACTLFLVPAGDKDPPGAPGPVPVKVKVLESEEIVVSSRFSGSVEPLQSTDLAFKLPGTVKALLRPGMIVSDLVGGQHDQKVMLLPMAAIHQGASPEQFMVYQLVVENGREVERARKVSLGGLYNNEVDVVPAGSEVMSGSRIVVTTAERLHDGAFVQVMQVDSPAAATRSEAK